MNMVAVTEDDCMAMSKRRTERQKDFWIATGRKGLWKVAAGHSEMTHF